MKTFLFKSVEDSQEDKFTKALTSAQIPNQIVPVISFNFCNLDNLRSKLEKYEEYEGIIFSSPRCVSAIAKCLKIDTDNTVRHWTSKKIFCVGKATKECAKTVFSSEEATIITPLIENADGLANQIVHELKIHERSKVKVKLLYPCGNLKRDTLTQILETNGTQPDPVEVYETVENPELKGVLLKDFQMEEDLSSFVFFSPSGLNFSLKYIKELILDGRPLVALGPTTKDALIKAGVEKNLYQCGSPEPESLVEVLNKIYNKEVP